MKTNLYLFEQTVKRIKIRYGSFAKNTNEMQARIKKELELAELHVHIDDGNYNERMIERAIALTKENKDDFSALEEKLQELKAGISNETGSRARMEILDQLMSSIKESVYGKGGTIIPDYSKITDKLEQAMQKLDVKIGERDYDDEIKVVWVNLREEMYAEAENRRTLSEHTKEAKANAEHVVSPRHIPSREDMGVR